MNRRVTEAPYPRGRRIRAETQLIDGGIPQFRVPPATKHAFTGGLLAYIDDIGARVAPDDPQSARAHVLSVFAMMAGTVQLARALADQHLADDVLEQGIRNALALFGVTHPM